MHQIVDNELDTEFLDNLVEVESILKSSGTDIPTLSAENDTSFLVRSVSSTTSQITSSVLSAFPTSSPFGSTVVPTPASDDTTIHPSISVFHTSPKPPSSITGHLSLCLTISADNIEVSSYQFHNHRLFLRNSQIHSVCSLYINVAFLFRFLCSQRVLFSSLYAIVYRLQ